MAAAFKDNDPTEIVRSKYERSIELAKQAALEASTCPPFTFSVRLGPITVLITTNKTRRASNGNRI